MSGRTAAYRRSAVVPVLDDLENEFFLGRRCVAGDDGRLTWLVLASGYRTVHQDSARALSMFPSTFRAFCKQRMRWSRNSYRCYLTAIVEGLAVARAADLAAHRVPDPAHAGDDGRHRLVYLVAACCEPAARRWPSRSAVRGCSWAARSARSPTCGRRPADILLLPLVTLVIMFVALPIKICAFLTMNKQGWLTRRADLIGGEGQDEASLTVREAPGCGLTGGTRAALAIAALAVLAAATACSGAGSAVPATGAGPAVPGTEAEVDPVVGDAAQDGRPGSSHRRTSGSTPCRP